MTHSSQLKSPKKAIVTEGRFGTQDISQQRQPQSARLKQSNIQKQGKTNARRVTQKSKYWNNCCKGENQLAKGAGSTSITQGRQR